MTKVETIVKDKSKMSQSLSELLLAFLEMERDRKRRARELTPTHKSRKLLKDVPVTS